MGPLGIPKRSVVIQHIVQGTITYQMCWLPVRVDGIPNSYGNHVGGDQEVGREVAITKLLHASIQIKLQKEIGLVGQKGTNKKSRDTNIMRDRHPDNQLINNYFSYFGCTGA